MESNLGKKALKESIVNDIKKVSERTGIYVSNLSLKKYKKEGEYSPGLLKDVFGSWGMAKKEAKSTGRKPNITKEQIIEDMKKVADNGLTAREYNDKGSYSVTTIRGKFGTWNKAKEEAGFTTYKSKISKEDMIKDLKKIKDEVDGYLSQNKYRDKGTYAVRTIINKFDTWNKAKEEAGLKAFSSDYKIADNKLLDDIRKADKECDGFLTASKYNNIGEHYANTIKNHFGSWNKAKEKAGVKTISKQKIIGKRIPDEKIIEKLKKGKNVKEIADEFGYCYTYLTHRIKKIDVKILNELSKANRYGGRVLSIKSKDIKKTKFGKDDKIYFEKKIEPDKIVLKLHEKRILEEDNN